VVDYLKRRLNAEAFCEINPAAFFTLGGVAIDRDVVAFPESTFYAFPDNDLVVFSSSIPRYEWFQFFNLIFDVARQQCHVKEIYTIGGMVSLDAHTASRDLWATFNSTQIKKSLGSYKLSRELDFETPPGGRPTLNAFLLWAAKRRKFNAANLWVPVPFYLVNSADPRAQKKALEFLDNRLKLKLDFTMIDDEIELQEQKIARLRKDIPEIDRSINKLEGNFKLSQAEHEKLIQELQEYLKKREG
jgi:proteasome assembly chaperone (PAC2) family protein